MNGPTAHYTFSERNQKISVVWVCSVVGIPLSTYSAEAAEAHHHIKAAAEAGAKREEI